MPLGGTLQIKSDTGKASEFTIRLPFTLAVTQAVFVKIGDTIFVHGGLSARYAAIPIDEINRRTAAALMALTDTPDSILNDQFGPLWYPDTPDATKEKQRATLAKRFGPAVGMHQRQDGHGAGVGLGTDCE